MTILTEALPAAVEIDGVEYAIVTDFRAALRCILAFEDDQLTPLEKTAVMLDNLYPERPGNLSEAIRLGLLYLNGGETGGEKQGPRLYSFAKDDRMIFAAFQQTHGIDLEKADLHWWKFLALFMDLGAETAFCQLVGLRKRVKNGKASKEERRIAAEMGDAFSVPEPDTRTPDEKARAVEFYRLVEEGKRQREKQKAEGEIQP